MEGIVHDNVRFVDEVVMFSCGVGLVCVIQMPPPFTAATNVLPSAELATEIQFVLGAFATFQVAPESVDVNTDPTFAAATSLLPSADEAIACQVTFGALADVQVVPASLEV